jgi:hypothetical protein
MTDSMAVARLFAEALNAGDNDAAALLLAEDAELVYPGRTVHGRTAWVEARKDQAAPSGLTESVADAVFTETDGGGVEMTARLVQQWAESGEVAHEQPVRVLFDVNSGAISRLEFLPA